MMELHHVADGPPAAPVVVLGGSLGSTLEMWQPQLPALTPRFRLIRYDHRGHGGSPSAPGPYRLDDLGADVIELLDRLGIERAHVGGLSLGGMVAMWLAIHAPERVGRLALMCTSANVGPPPRWTERAAAVRRGEIDAVADTIVERWFTAAFAAQEPEQIEHFRTMIASSDPEGYAGCCEAIGAMNLLPELGRVQAPTLIIAGADDPSTPPEHAEAIAARVPAARVEVLQAAAHLASWEQAEAVNALLVDHLTQEGDR
jgi:3-oxoadipate enol-lactonase